MSDKLYETRSEFYRLPNRVPMALYQPTVKTDRSKIAVLAMHGGDYMSFPPMVELAKYGFITAGANPSNGGMFEGPATDFTKARDVGAAVDFLRNYPGVEKVVLMGHSNGGCLMSCYEYIAENGMDRFKKYNWFYPLPDLKLSPADGMMLLDANYGIMEILAMDPAVDFLHPELGRIPELDIYNPANGYKKDDSHYDPEFVRRFQKGLVDYYRRLISYCKERYAAIQAGEAMFEDDEQVLLPGAGFGSSSNKLFIQDTDLLGWTKEAHDILHGDGTITNDIVHTRRLRSDSPNPRNFKMGSNVFTVTHLLGDEKLFHDDFGYDSSSMWGLEEEQNSFSTRANVRGIHIPSLFQGNTASHEFINTEMNYFNSAAEDKTAIFLEGAHHMFGPEKRAEKFPGEFGDTLGAIVKYMADWIDSRFM